MAAAAAAAGRAARRPRAGPAAARNAGLRAAGTPLVAFLDSDCVPRARLAGAAAPAPRRPAAGRRRPADRRAARAAGGRWFEPRTRRRSAPSTWARTRAVVRPGSAVSYVPSAALLVRRAALGDGFDEAMRVAEDVDLVWRLAAAGWRVRYEPAAAVAHEHPADDGGVAAPPRVLRHRRRAAGRPARRARSPRWWSPRRPPLAWALVAVRAAGGRGGRRPSSSPSPPPGSRRGSPARGSGRPPASPPLLVARGDGRVRPRAGPLGHPPPLAAGAAGRRCVSRRARRWVLAAAAADAVAGLVAAPAAGGTGPFRRRPAAGGPRLRRRAVGGRRPGPRARGRCCRPAAPDGVIPAIRPAGMLRRPTTWAPRSAARPASVPATTRPEEELRDHPPGTAHRHRPGARGPARPARPAPRCVLGALRGHRPADHRHVPAGAPDDHPRARDDVGGGAAHPDRHARRPRAGPAGARPAVGRAGPQAARCWPAPRCTCWRRCW